MKCEKIINGKKCDREATKKLLIGLLPLRLCDECFEKTWSKKLKRK